MRIRRMALWVAVAAGLAALPVSAARAQYYHPYYAPCAFPLAWPFCVAGAVVGTAATIATAPFWALAGVPPYGYYGPPYAPGYYPPPYATYAPPLAAAPEAAPAPLTPPPPGTHPPASYAPPAVRDVYYFCPASKSYYPYVGSCAVAWRRVPTTPPKL